MTVPVSDLGMMALLFLLSCFAVVVACAGGLHLSELKRLEAGKDKPKGISIFPAIPLFPILAMVLAWGFNTFSDFSGYLIITSLQVIIIVFSSCAIAYAQLKIKRLLISNHEAKTEPE